MGQVKNGTQWSRVFVAVVSPSVLCSFFFTFSKYYINLGHLRSSVMCMSRVAPQRERFHPEGSYSRALVRSLTRSIFNRISASPNAVLA